MKKFMKNYAKLMILTYTKKQIYSYYILITITTFI